jgi:uncharacterized HhH-GPD family protein
VGKYDAWEKYFRTLEGDSVELTFAELEGMLSDELPPSASRFEPWWGTGQPQARWGEAGWIASPDLVRRVVRFSKRQPRLGRPSSDLSAKAEPGNGSRLILLGCVSTKAQYPAPAKDIYVSDLWRKRRAYAESTGEPWLILSAEYGLVDPDQVIEPYDRSLKDESPKYRSRWAHEVSVQVIERCRHLGVESVEVHAGASYLESGLIAALNRAGIKVIWPLRGRRIGEQLEWYSTRGSTSDRRVSVSSIPDRSFDGLLRRISRLEKEVAELSQRLHGIPSVRRSPDEDNGLSLDRKRLIAARIVEHGRNAVPVSAGPSALIFTPVAEADHLVRTDPFAFLLGVVFDQGITAERAWEGPWLLQQRLGHLDPERLAQSPTDVQRAVAQPPSLHRYIEIVPGWIVLAAEKIWLEYGGDAAAIWSDNPTVDVLRARLEAFKGIGVKKSAMAVEMLERDLGVSIRGMDRSDIAYDVHLRRVFIRTGLAERDEIGHMTEVARQIHPDRPGELDLPTWMIGREWCHPGVPDCPACVLDNVCDHRIEQGSAVKGA